MTIGIIGAMDLEVTLLIEALENKKQITYAGQFFHCGKIGQHNVVVLRCGIGKVSASVGTTLLISHFSPQLIINTGTAGGLRNTHIFDLIIATSVAHHDVDVTDFGYQIGQQAQMPPVYVPNNEYVQLAQKICRKYTSHLLLGQVVSGDSFISNPKRKTWIQENFPQALAVEMEASAIAQTCHMLQVPFLLIRAISDNAGEGNTISYEQFVSQAGRISAQMNLDFIKNINA